MGHKSSKRKRARHTAHKPGEKRSGSSWLLPKDSKLSKYAATGNTRKLKALLADAGNTAVINTVADDSGATALHHAARHGHTKVVALLLRRSADPAICDAAGNSPGHLAAMHGHWLVLTELVKAADIDLDKPNAAGFTIRQIVQQQQQQGQGTQSFMQASSTDDTTSSCSISRSDSGAEAAATSDHRTTTRTRHASRLPAAAAAAAAAGTGTDGHLDGPDDWLDKLAYEMSYDDGEGLQSAWGDAIAAHAAAGEPMGQRRTRKHPTAAGTTRSADLGSDDDDDVWADRLWQDMQEHKRQAAAAQAAAAAAKRKQQLHTDGRLFTAGPSRADVAEERQRKAAAAAAESARILHEEQAKDADWRAAMKRQVEEAALPLRRSTYEERWQLLESWPKGKRIRYQDVPWPCPTPGSQAAAHKQQQQQQVLHLDPQHLRTLVLAGAKNPADVKLALRKELMRWHPDKFTARFGARLAADDQQAIQAGVHAVAQQLTALKQQ